MTLKPAFLFDRDGTIVDAMPLHCVAWSKASSEWKCALSKKLLYEWGVNEQQGLQMPVDEMSQRKIGATRSFWAAEDTEMGIQLPPQRECLRGKENLSDSP